MQIRNGMMEIGTSVFPLVNKREAASSQTRKKILQSDLIPMEYDGDEETTNRINPIPAEIDFDDPDEITKQTDVSVRLQGEMHHLMDRCTDLQKQVALEVVNIILELTAKEQADYLEWGQFIKGAKDIPFD